MSSEMSSSSITSLVETLNNKTSKVSDKQDAYGFLSTRLRDVESAELSDLPISKLEEAMYKDVGSATPTLSQAALQVLGVCMYLEEVVNRLDTKKAISSLCDVIVKTNDKVTCTRALWCLAKQQLRPGDLREQLSEILQAIEHGQCKKNFQSLTVEYEALCAIVRLLEMVPYDMETHAPRWGKLVYPLLLHDSPKIRVQAMVAMEMGMVAMEKHRDELVQVLVPDLKSLLVSQMSKLMSTKLELHVLKVWRLYVTLLGKVIHHGSLINNLLPIVEQGFKNSAPEVRIMAYQAWETLMDNFALNKDIISNQKRVKLLMQVFRINNAKYEAVALEKLKVWWHFVCLLKENASMYYDQVCAPLLQFAFCGHVSSSGTTPGKTPNRTSGLSGNFKSPATPSSSPIQTFTSVQHKGCEMLAHILGRGVSSPDNPKPMFTVEAPEVEIIVGTTVFAKHAISVIGSVKLCLETLGDQIEDSLLHHVWFAAVAHIKNILQVVPKRDSVDIFQAFLSSYQDLVEGQVLAPEKLLKLLEAVLCLPQNVLGSSSYSPTVQGTASMFLMRCLFHHRILETNSLNNIFLTIHDKLVGCVFTHETSALTTSQSVLEELETAVAQIDSVDVVNKLWTSLANPLLHLILKTTEVNQGTNMEHDFTCLLKTLTFPLTHIYKSPLSQNHLTSSLKTWGKLYAGFARVAALVNTAPANTSCEELCSKLLLLCDKQKLQDESFVWALTQFLVTIVETVEFSSLSNTATYFGFKAQSPSGFGRKKSLLQNVNSFVILMSRVLKHCVSLNDDTADLKKPKTLTTNSLVNLVQVLTTLFTHLPTSSMIAELVEQVAEPLGKLYEGLGKKNIRGFTPHVAQKAERLWQDVVTALQGKYNGPYDTDFLHQVAPLLAATFLHPRQKIKNQTTMFWNSTFAHGPPLSYPEILKPVLAKVKDKLTILLPGWDVTTVMAVGETPSNSIISQAESQAPLPNIVGIGSPRKPAGSFLNKVVSHNLEPSPVRTIKSPQKATVKSPKIADKTKKKLSLNINDMKVDDFVVIRNSPRKKHVLTSHQKEVLKERSTIPAMYSTVDASQDVSLMSKFNTESQMSVSDSMSLTPTPTPISDITPFPLFSKAKGDKLVNGIDRIPEKVSTVVPSGSPKQKKPGRKPRAVRFSSVTEGKENVSDMDSTGTDEDSAAKTTKSTEVEKSSAETIVIDESEEVDDKEIGSMTVEASEERMDISSSEQESMSLLPDKAAMEMKNVAVNKADVKKTKENEGSVSKARQIDDILSPNSHFLQSSIEIDLTRKDSDSQKSVSASPRRSNRRSGKHRASVDSASDASDLESAPGPQKRVNDSKEMTKLRPKTRRSSLLDSITEDTQPESVKTPVVASRTLPILVEDTQQMSPPSISATGNKPTKKENVEIKKSVRETPEKETGESEMTETTSCTKNLFTAEEKNPKKSAKENNSKAIPLVPYAETQPDSDFSSLSQLSSPEMIPSSQPSLDEVKDEPVTPPQYPRLDLKRLTMSPVVQIERLSQIELSPQKTIKVQALLTEDDTSASIKEAVGRRRRRSRLAQAADVKLGKADGSSESQSQLSSQDSIASKASCNSQNSSASQAADKLDVERKISQDMVVDGEDKTVTETEKQNVFIVEILDRTDTAENTPDELTQDVMEVDLTETQHSEVEKEAKGSDKDQPGEVTNNALNTDREHETEEKTIVPVSEDITDCESSHLPPTPRSRNRKPPVWLTDMELSGSKRKNLRKQESAESIESQSDLGQSAKTRKNRRRSLRMSGPSSELCSQEVDKVSSQEEPEHVARVPADDPAGSRLDDDLQSEQDIFADDPKNNVGIVNSDCTDIRDINMSAPSLQLEMSVIDEKIPESPASISESSASAKETSEPDKPVSSEKGLPSSQDDLSMEELETPQDKSVVEFDSDNEDELPLSSLSSKVIGDEGDNKMASSQESVGFILPDSDSQENILSGSTAIQGGEGETLSEDEPLSQLKTSTPQSLKRGRRSPKAFRRTPKASPKSRLRSQLSIDMKSPTNKSLRSSGQKTYKSRTLNRSMDSITRSADKRKRLKVRKSHQMIKDDVDVGSKDGANVCTEEIKITQTEEKMAHDVKEALADVCANVAVEVAEEALDDTEITQDVWSTSETNSVLKEDAETKHDQVDEADMEVMNSLSVVEQKQVEEAIKPRFVSPLRSPPRKGKPFNLPDTPPSHSKHTLLSRASLILQRAKMSKPSSTGPLPRGRGPLAAVPATEPAKPGILKSPTGESQVKPAASTPAEAHKGSPPGCTFRPINLPRIYSPSASPSAGILRKRKLSGDLPVSSPSPPSKQRRVCFNEKIQTREIPSAQKQKQKMKASPRVVGRGSPKPVNRCLDMPQNQISLPPSPLVDRGKSRMVMAQEKFITSTIPKVRVLDMKATPVEPAECVADSDLGSSPASIQCTGDTQLSYDRPVFPDLVGCDLPVDSILPQLTSSTWSVGLGQLVHSMNINTIGELSSLTEAEIHNLPIKSPKVQTMVEALKTVEWTDSTQTHLDGDLEDENPLPPRKSLQSLEEELAKIAPPADDPNTSVESNGTAIMEPRDLLDEIHRLGDDRKSTPPASPVRSVARADTVLVNVVETMKKDFLPSSISSLQPGELLDIYCNLNKMKTEINEIMVDIVMELKNKCPSSP